MNGIRRGIAALVMTVGLVATANADDGFVSIFNGKDLTGWDGNPKFWSVQDGAITGQTTKENPTQGNTFLLWKAGEVDDFELQLTYKIVGGNSGIQYRSKHHGNWVVGGYQADIDSSDTYSGINYEERGRGILAERGQRATIGADGKKSVESIGDKKGLQDHIKKEDWNQYELIAKGTHLTHKINGKVMSETVDSQTGKAMASGILALQLHAGPPMTVQFKDIKIKRTRLAAAKKVVLVAGTPSHGPMDHEFNAGVLLLKKCLDKTPGVVAAAYLNGWPKDPTAFDNADGILLYMDGGGGHPAIQPERLKQLGALMKSGVGLACAHYAVEVPADRGGPEFVDWIGGYYETGFSINPHWDGAFNELPKHPITRGVKPFKINDEWYYNIRFRPSGGEVVNLLTATPPDNTRGTKAAKDHPGRAEVVSWCVERPDGGRGFGFTGGHKHINWGNDDFRKFVLNALLWVAKAEVPENGVESVVKPQELRENLDPKRR